jgi:L-cysteine desulfidase
MGGTYEQICAAVKNMIANLTGMICDGAKPSCALKLTSGVSTAVLSAMLAMQGNCVSSIEGIIDDDVDQCVRNLVSIGAHSMNETDKQVLDIMVGKKIFEDVLMGRMYCGMDGNFYFVAYHVNRADVYLVNAG